MAETTSTAETLTEEVQDSIVTEVKEFENSTKKSDQLGAKKDGNQQDKGGKPDVPAKRKSSRVRKQTDHFAIPVDAPKALQKSEANAPNEKQEKIGKGVTRVISDEPIASGRVTKGKRIERQLFDLCSNFNQDYRDMFRKLVWAKIASYPWSPAIVCPPYLSKYPKKLKQEMKNAFVQSTGDRLPPYLVLWLGPKKTFSRIDQKHVKLFNEETVELYSKGVIGGKKKITKRAAEDLSASIKEAEDIRDGKGELLLEEDPDFEEEDRIAASQAKKRKTSPSSTTKEVASKRGSLKPGEVKERALAWVENFIEEMPLRQHLPDVAKRIKKRRKKERKEKKHKKKAKHKKKDKARRNSKSSENEADDADDVAMEEDTQDKGGDSPVKKSTKRKAAAAATEAIKKKRAKLAEAEKAQKKEKLASESHEDRVKRLGTIVTKYATKGPSFNEDKVLRVLLKLANIEVTHDLVVATKIGVVVANMRKHESPNIAKLAKKVRKRWIAEFSKNTNGTQEGEKKGSSNKPPSENGTKAGVTSTATAEEGKAGDDKKNGNSESTQTSSTSQNAEKVVDQTTEPSEETKVAEPDAASNGAQDKEDDVEKQVSTDSSKSDEVVGSNGQSSGNGDSQINSESK